MAAHSSSGYSGRWVCQADRVFDGECVRAGEALIIDGDTVAAVVPAHLVPPALPVLSAPGCTALPGLMDLHVHFMRWQGPLFVAYGVTTIRDVGNQQDWILARRAECGGRLWPRIYTFGPLLDGPVPVHPSFSRACADLASARAAVVETATTGADGINCMWGCIPNGSVRWWRPGMPRGCTLPCTAGAKPACWRRVRLAWMSSFTWMVCSPTSGPIILADG